MTNVLYSGFTSKQHSRSHKPCTMFRQSLRQSVSPAFRSGSARTQPGARAYHAHTFWRPPHQTSHRCLRPYVPIQVTAALLQLCPCQSGRHCSPPSSRSFHSTQSVQGAPLLSFLVIAFKVSPQLSCGRSRYSLLLALLVIYHTRSHSNRWSCCTHLYPCSSGKKSHVAEATQEN